VALLLISTAILAGCIANDQITTWVIYPDGSAKFMKIESNVHSTERGPKGERELANYISEFEAGRTGDHLRMKEAGGQLLESRWLNDSEPRANLMVVTFPAAAALERAMSLQDENGHAVVTAKLIFDGSKRRLQWTVNIPPSESTDTTRGEPEQVPSYRSVRTAQANGISETRIAITGGKIRDARGFLVASDSQSALLELSTVAELIRLGKPFDLFLEWELTEN
jgi:hypothetical protein